MLAPLLLNIFMNDVSLLGMKGVIFADDAKIFNIFADDFILIAQNIG